MITGIYKITNQINQKCYIGQAIDIETRWKKHRNNAFNEHHPGYIYPLYCAIRKYGLENFSFEVLEECKREELGEREVFYIAKYNAYCNGYNQNEGGPHAACHCSLSAVDVDKVIERLKTTSDSTTTIAEDFGVSVNVVRTINNGKYYRRESEVYPIRDFAPKVKQMDNGDSEYYRSSTRRVERPAPLDLAKMIIELGFVKVGERFGVSDNAIKRWCKTYDIPHHKNEIVEWYTKQIDTIDTIDDETIARATYNSKKPVKQIDINTGEVLAIFESVSAACKAVSCKNTANISNACNGIYKASHGYYWRFA